MITFVRDQVLRSSKVEEDDVSINVCATSLITYALCWGVKSTETLQRIRTHLVFSYNIANTIPPVCAEWSPRTNTLVKVLLVLAASMKLSVVPARLEILKSLRISLNKKALRTSERRIVEVGGPEKNSLILNSFLRCSPMVQSTHVPGVPQ